MLNEGPNTKQSPYINLFIQNNQKKVDEWLLGAGNGCLVAKVTEFLFRGMDGHMPQ